MANSSRVPPQLKPFKKGDDPRRNALGRVSQARSTWMAKFLNALAAELEPEEAAKKFAAKYRAGVPFFVGEAHERLGGKVTQPMEHSTPGADNAFVLQVVHTNGSNGGGNGNGGDGGNGKEKAAK